MRSVTASVWLSVGLVALSATGCYGPMYSPYGYNQPTYPTYGAPGTFQTLTPGGTYVPGGTYMPGTGGTVLPGTTYPPGSSIPNSNLPTPTYDSNGGNAQPWGGGSAVPVPDPYYGNEFRPPVSPTTSIPTPGEASLAHGAGLNNEFFRARPVSRERSLASAPQPTNSGMSPSAGTGDENTSSGTPTDTTALEGTVQYDAASSQWTIAYRGASPESDEVMASEGQMTLAASPLLQTLRAGETVRLEGQVNGEERDAAGQPKFQLLRIIRNVASR